MSQGTKLTRLADKMYEHARADLKRRLREKLSSVVGACIDETVEDFMKNLQVEIDPETLAIVVKGYGE